MRICKLSVYSVFSEMYFHIWKLWITKWHPKDMDYTVQWSTGQWAAITQWAEVDTKAYTQFTEFVLIYMYTWVSIASVIKIIGQMFFCKLKINGGISAKIPRGQNFQLLGPPLHFPINTSGWYCTHTSAFICCQRPWQVFISHIYYDRWHISHVLLTGRAWPRMAPWETASEMLTISTFCYKFCLGFFHEYLGGLCVCRKKLITNNMTNNAL